MKKCNVIKRVAICVIAVLTMSVAARAQEKGDFAVGAHVALGMGDDLTNFGLGAKALYNITSPIRVEGVFNFFLPKKEKFEGVETKTNMWDLSLNAHYLFRLSDKFVLYPLAGVGILGVKSSVSMDLGEFDGDISASASEFGFNLGAGFDFKLSEKLALNVQAKYMFAGDWGRFVPTAGIIYKF